MLHVGVVVFVVAGEGLFLLGGWLGWSWVHHFRMRLTHLLLMVFIALQTALGQLCPLTVWEQILRARARDGEYSGSFIEHWLGRLLYVSAPWWAFVVAYSAFALLVGLTWHWVRPRR
jgi:hypothetical protein